MPIGTGPGPFHKEIPDIHADKCNGNCFLLHRIKYIHGLPTITINTKISENLLISSHQSNLQAITPDKGYTST